MSMMQASRHGDADDGGHHASCSAWCIRWWSRIAQVLFPDKANGQLIERERTVIGSRIIGQPFTSPGYFYSRPSAAGAGYDAGASSGSNLGPTNRKLVDRVAADVARLQRRTTRACRCPIDLVTTSGSGPRPAHQPGRRDVPGRSRRAGAGLRRKRCGSWSTRTPRAVSSASSASRWSTCCCSTSRWTSARRCAIGDACAERHRPSADALLARIKETERARLRI